MKIKVAFTGTCFMDGLRSGGSVEVGDGTTIAEFLETHDVKPEFQPFIITFINGEPKESSYILQEEDELTLFLPVSGG
ncbi:MAG: MoaD/ThiS family protein [Planctomycetota bacterium]|jgi:sulfur carrier protein ThiS